MTAPKKTIHEASILTRETPTDWLLTAIFTLLCVSIVFNIFSLYFLTGNSLKFSDRTEIDTFGIKKAILEVEYEKVGGRENFELVNKASLMQLQEQLPSIKQFVEGGGGASPSPTGPTITSDISPEDIATIRKDAVIEGNKDASILVIEYSDMECPFCMKQYHETELSTKLKAQYGDKLGFVFKNNRGVNHPGTEQKALGALCAQRVGGDESYTKFYKGVMDNSTNEGGVYDVTKLADLAKTVGVDTAKWQECVNKKETLDLFTAQTNEAKKYGMSGTPGTLILNTTTGKYSTVEGAYPYDTFTEKIDLLLQ